VLDVSEVRSIFELLCNSRDKKEVDIGDGRLETGYLEGVSKVFIQQDSTKEMLLNKVLKNNFINGSYILEFFDCDKKIVNVLNTVQFRKMTDSMQFQLICFLYQIVLGILCFNFRQRM